MVADRSLQSQQDAVIRSHSSARLPIRSASPPLRFLLPFTLSPTLLNGPFALPNSIHSAHRQHRRARAIHRCSLSSPSTTSLPFYGWVRATGCSSAFASQILQPHVPLLPPIREVSLTDTSRSLKPIGRKSTVHRGRHRANGTII